LKTKLAILGCGWLGQHLIQSLQDKNIEIWASAQSDSGYHSLLKLPIHALKINIPQSNPHDLKFFFYSDCLLISIAWKKIDLEQTKVLYEWFASIKNLPKKVIFCSSTSVYPSQGICKEDTPLVSNLQNAHLIVLEEMLTELFQQRLIIFRLAGLMGENRHPGNFLSGKTVKVSENEEINLVHLYDVMAFIQAAIACPTKHGIYNLCGDEHFQKAIFYRKASEKIYKEAPIFDFTDKLSVPKRIDNQKAQTTFDINFLHTQQWIQEIMK
jgi:nucleoside-diphosphate-sugar epimerase